MFSSAVFANPYQGLTFGQFILHFFYRLGQFLTGHLGLDALVTDEIQVLVLSGIAISSALVGTFLILRRMTMLANSLAHTILLGIVIAYVISMFWRSDYPEEESFAVPMQALLVASLLMGFLTSFLTEFLTKTLRLQADASTGIIFTALFALGIILVTLLTRSAHIGIEAVMGNADALHVEDLKWVFYILVMNILIIVLFFKEFKITTFDPGLAYALGISNTFFSYLLMAQVSATAIGSFRAVGVFLVLAFMTGPSLTARLLTHRLKAVLGVASLLGTLAALFGVALTRHLLTVFGIALSTSGVVVCLISFFYLLVILFAPERGVFMKYWIRRHSLLSTNKLKIE